MPTPTEDREAIRDVVAKYCHYIDTGERDAWVGLFTDDGEFDAGKAVVGREALTKFAAKIEPGAMHHTVTDPMIEVDGDTATCTASSIVYAKSAIMLVGRSYDELQRVDGTWRIARRRYEFDAK